MFRANAFTLAIFLSALASCGQISSPDTSDLNDTDSNDKRTTEPLPTLRVVRLSDYSGKSFYNVMTRRGGIIDLITEDQTAPFLVKDSEQILSSLNSHYSDKVIHKVGNQSTLASLVTGLRTRQGTDGYSTHELKRSGVERASVEIIGLGSGAGVMVEVDSDNFFYNISYEHGERKPGRSYSVGPARKSDDVSYPDYFDRLQSYLEHATDTDVALFYRSMFQLLGRSDARSIDILNKYGENLLTDYMMIYVAEAYRKLTGGSGGEFHQDLTETTLLAAWSQRTGKVPSPNGTSFRIIDGDLEDYINRSDNGSGLGFHNPRRRLQSLVCDAVRDLNRSLMAEIEAIIVASPHHDCYETIAWFLNAPDSQDSLSTQGDALAEAIGRFVTFTRQNADEILSRIYHNLNH